MTVVSTSNAEHYVWGGNCDGWHLARTSSLSVIQERVPSGGAEVRHYHERSQQFFYVLAGIASLEIDGKEHRLEPRQGIHIHAGVPHRLRNEGEVDLEFVVVSTPPSHGDRVPA